MSPASALDELRELIATAARAAQSGDDNQRTELTDLIRDHPSLPHLGDPEDPPTEPDLIQAADHAARLLALSGQAMDLPTVARLSLVAHQAGADGAGVIHAEASDKIALFSGQPQLYGTVMIEQGGDIVQPPVNPTVGDGERLALGLPTLDQMTERMATLARDLAIERAGQPGWLPPGQRWCRVWTDPDPAELRTRLAADESAWAEGDVLMLAQPTPTPFTAAPVFEQASWDAGEGIQLLSLRVQRLDEAVITYTFNPVDPAAMTPPSFARGSHDGRFRGPNAPAELASNDPLVGTTFDVAVESEGLGEPRTVTVYRPPDHSPGEAIPVIYATDGNMFAPYLRRLDAAIEAGWCPRAMVIAAHSARFDPFLGNRRAAEYLPGFDPAAHHAHRRFFADELPAWAETTLGVATTADRRAVFGCSDGAGHALLVARELPDSYAHAFAFSTGMPPDLSYRWSEGHPTVHLCAGTLEGAFFDATEAWADYLDAQGVPHHFTERVCGHDLIQWVEELPRTLARAFA